MGKDSPINGVETTGQPHAKKQTNKKKQQWLVRETARKIAATT